MMLGHLWTARIGIVTRWALVVGLAWFCIWIQSLTPHMYQSPPETVALREAQALWQEQRIVSYAMRLRLTTPTDPGRGGELLLEVLNTTVFRKRCEPKPMTCEIYYTPGWQVDGVPALFYLARHGFQDAAGTTPGCVEVAYDPVYGYPRWIDSTRCGVPELRLIPVQLEVIDFDVIHVQGDS
jgi:Family of unknown function (DUF6174)